MSLNAGMHLGQLLQQKLQEQNMDNDAAMNYVLSNQQNIATPNTETITTLQTRIAELEEKLTRQREITNEWRIALEAANELRTAVRNVIEDVIYGSAFQEHMELKTQEIIDRNGFNNTINYNDLAESLNYDAIASKINLGELAADHIDQGELADRIANDLDLSDVASQIDMSDLASHIDASDVASEIDMYDLSKELDMSLIADNINCSDLASELSTRVRVSVDFAY